MSSPQQSESRPATRSGLAGRLWRKRAAANRGLLIATAGAVLVVTFVLSAIVGIAARSPLAAVQDTLAATPNSSISDVLSLELAESADSQTARVRTLLAKTFRGAPLTTARTVLSDAWPIAVGSAGTKSSDDARSVVFLQDDAALASRIHITDGATSDLAESAAGQPPAVAIDASGAKALRVTTGDTLTLQIDDRRFPVRIVGVWEPRDANALGWVGASAGVSGSSARLLGSPATLQALQTPPTVQFALAPTSASARPGDLANYAYGFRHLGDRATAVPQFDGLAVNVSGDGITTITAMQDSLAALGAVLPVPIAVLVISALIALVLLAQLLGASRENETRLLRARGAAIGSLLRVGAVESAVVAVTGSFIGAVAAQAWLLIAVGPPTDPAEPIVPFLATALVATAVSLGISTLAAVRASGAPRPESGRARTAGSWSLTVLLLVAAAITVWRFLQYGLPLPGQPADPVGVFAPAAALCALAMLGLVSLGPLTRRVELLAKRTVGLNAVLPARQIGRNLGLFAAPVALLVLTIGASTFAAAYVGTWTTFLSGSSRLTNGSDLRIAFDGPTVVSGDSELIDASIYTKLKDVAHSAPALQMGAEVGDQSVSVIGVSAERLPDLSTVDSAMFDASAARAQLLGNSDTSLLRGVTLPKGATSLTLSVLATRENDFLPEDAASVVPTVWIADAAGDLIPESPGSLAVARLDGATPVDATVRLPRGGPWSVVALDVGVHVPSAIVGFDFTVKSLHVTTGTKSSVVSVPGSQNWVPQTSVFGSPSGKVPRSSTLGEVAIPVIAASAIDTTAVRLMPKGADKVPVIVNRTMAAILGLKVGDPVEYDGDWASFTGNVVGIVPVVPGVSSGLSTIVDLRALEDGALRTSTQLPALNEYWIASPASAEIAAHVAELAGTSATVTTASGALSARFLGSAVIGLWFGAFGCAAFALVALAGAIGATARRRAGEVIVLRAVGMSARQQGAARRTEILIVVGYSVLFGLLSGAIVSLLAASPLARLSVAAAPRVLPIQNHLDLGTLAIAVVALVAAISVITWWFVRSVTHRAAAPAMKGGQ